METTTLWHLSNAKTALKSEVLIPKPGEILIQSLYSLISMGTEKLVACGKVPSEIYLQMKVPFMQGDFSFPLTYGYSVVGKIIDGPEKYLNATIQMLHPHQSYIYAATDKFSVLPPEVPAKRATLASNLETIVNAIWDSEVSLGDKILVVGFGLIGALLCQVLKGMPGVEIQVMEADQHRANLATILGHKNIRNPTDQVPMFDVAFNTSSNESGLQACIDAVGYEGRIVELSWYGNQAVNMSLGSNFHHMRKRIISSQVSSIPSIKTNRWDFDRRKALVLQLLKDPGYDQLITQEIEFESAPSFFDNLRNNQIDQLSTVIKY